MTVSKKFWIFGVLTLLVFNAYAEPKVGIVAQKVDAAQAKTDIGGILEPAVQQKIEEERTKTALRNDIRILDEEINKCQKQKRAWTAATVVGSVGVVATGVSAGVQGAKLKEKKATLQKAKEHQVKLGTDE